MEVIAYKGMKSDMTCRGFQYEIGKSYKTDKAELCECGFHACLNPKNVIYYYSTTDNSRYFKVKLSGEITKCGNYNTNVAATEITILEEITDNFDELCKNVEWWKNKGVLDLLYYQEGFARIQRGDGLWNFIDTKGKILSDEWFGWCDKFYEGFVRVQRNEDNLWNLIDEKGKLLSDEWFGWCGDFSKGFAVVRREDGLYNFIDKQGKLLSDEWFEWCSNFSKGFAIVRREDGLYNFIDKQGKLLFDEWFEWCSNFSKGFAIVRRWITNLLPISLKKQVK